MKPTTKQLCEAVTEMDSASQSAFTEIATIAELALLSLETPEAYVNPECLAIVLKAIRNKALDAENHINSTVEEVECNYKSQSRNRRMDARRQAKKATSNKVTS